MKKNALLAVLLVMTLLLSSCALIVKDKEVDAKTVILKLGDKEYTKEEVEAYVNATLQQNADSYYYYYGQTLDITNPENIASARTSVINSLKQEMTLRAKAAELKLDQLTDEEKAEVAETAKEDYQDDMEIVKSLYFTDSELQGEELDKAVAERLEDLRGGGMELYEEESADTIVSRKLREYVVKDVTVSEEEIKADYDAKVAADEEKYKDNPASWTSADRGGSTLYYAPAGIRRVQQILIKFKADDQTAVDNANSSVTAANTKITDAQKVLDDAEASEEDKAKAQADLDSAKAELEAAEKAVQEAIDAAYLHLDEETDAVLAALAEDPASWSKLQEEKNEDPGMKPGAVNAERGYSVYEGMTAFDSAFVNAAMALNAVGDVSGKIRGSSNGYYIIRYAGDVAEGPVDYASVKDSLQSTLLSSKQSTLYTETVNQWVKEAGIKEDLGALNN